MGLISLVHADLIKQRHTAYFGIHTLIPIVGAALFTFYYLLYKAVDELQRLKLLLELTAMVFPVLIGIIVGLNILQEEIAAFGDGENDLEMIQYAGFGVAMGNAVESLKQAADHVAPPCEEDGVACVLEQFL